MNIATTEKSLEEKLMEEIKKIGGSIIHDDKGEIPEIDYSNFRTTKEVPSKMLLASFVDGLARYLHLPCMVDNFEDDKARNKWEQEMLGKHGREMYDLLQRNALGGNNIGIPMTYVEMLEQCYIGENPEFRVLSRRIKDSVHRLQHKGESEKPGYDHLLNGEKLEVAKSIRQDIYALLKAVAKTSS